MSKKGSNNSNPESNNKHKIKKYMEMSILSHIKDSSSSSLLKNLLEIIPKIISHSIIVKSFHGKISTDSLNFIYIHIHIFVEFKFNLIKFHF